MAGLVAGDLIIEDGTGIVDANSYSAIAGATEYHRLRCNSDWADAGEADQVAALIRGTDYLERRWCFLGTVLTDEQRLHFPIESVFYDARGIDVGETVPVQIEEALYEYALRAVTAGDQNILLPDPVTDPGGFVKEKFEKIGPLTEQTKWDTSRGLTVLHSYPQADRILYSSGLVDATRGGRTIRA